MKKQLMTGLFTVLALTAGAQTFQEWRNPEINAVNRAPMHTNYFAFENADAAKKANKKQSTNYMTLNGTWKFNWVKDADSRPTDFWKTGFNDKGWDDLQVPAVWELNGYGDPIYVNVGYAWRNQFQNNPPEVPTENNHVGSYRREIVVPASWKGKDIIAHFGSVTSNMYLWVNGRYVGYSEDSKLEAEFDLTPYLKPGQKNLIAFQVFRWCDGTYLEDQDFFRYSGVGRDCYLYARNKKRIQDIRVTPDLDAAYQNGSLAVNLDLKSSGKVDLELVDAQGKQVATATANKSGLVTMNVENPKKWSAETPYLYTLRASMQGSNEVIPVKVGFRKIELKGDQILVNGKAVLFKGADRHEMDPDGGYVVSPERMLQDIQIMKQFNLNAVRTCHYPDDNLWYDLCDQYGIYVVRSLGIDPATGKEIYLDKNGNPTTVWNTADRVYAGVDATYGSPYRGNASTMIRWKDFTLNVSFGYQWGGQTYNSTLIDRVEVTNLTIGRQNVDQRVFSDRWQKPGDKTFFKGYSNEATYATSRFVMDDNWFDIQSVSLQYRYSTARLQQATGLQSILFGVNMSDLWHFSSIKYERGTSYPFARNIQGSVTFLF